MQRAERDVKIQRSNSRNCQMRPMRGETVIPVFLEKFEHRKPRSRNMLEKLQFMQSIICAEQTKTALY